MGIYNGIPLFAEPTKTVVPCLPGVLPPSHCLKNTLIQGFGLGATLVGSGARISLAGFGARISLAFTYRAWWALSGVGG